MKQASGRDHDTPISRSLTTGRWSRCAKASPNAPCGRFTC